MRKTPRKPVLFYLLPMHHVLHLALLDLILAYFVHHHLHHEHRPIYLSWRAAKFKVELTACAQQARVIHLEVGLMQNLATVVHQINLCLQLVASDAPAHHLNASKLFALAPPKVLLDGNCYPAHYFRLHPELVFLPKHTNF